MVSWTIDHSQPTSKSIAKGLGVLYRVHDLKVLGCWKQNPTGEWVCTLEANHSGPHIAHGGAVSAKLYHVITLWGDLTEEELETIIVKARLLS